MRPKVAGIQNAFSTHLDEQHIRIESGMVGQEGRDGERPHRKRNAAFPRNETVRQPLAEHAGTELDQPPGGLAGMNRPTRRHILQEPVMILMGVRNQNAIDRGTTSSDFGKRPVAPCGASSGRPTSRIMRCPSAVPISMQLPPI